MKLISPFLIICLVLTCLYFVGLLTFLTDYAVDQCQMTYMFEYPQFVRIAHDIDKRYPKYELHAYSEGRFTEKARKMDFSGIPVLFIPGNAGSHKQVRSLSSIALRKAVNSRTSFHFDYFTVNLNEEFSGISGVVLNDQLDYVNHSIYRVLDLYKDKYKPKSVILVGHSMGGVIAHSIVSSLPENSQLITIVIALSAPLKRPPVAFDYHLENFYKNVGPSMPKSITFVSLAGGFSDFLISSGLTNLKNRSIIHAVTTNVPLSWVESDHVQILWCKQTVLAINRALFDSVDLKTKQISDNAEVRAQVFHHHLVDNSGVKIQQIGAYGDKFNVHINGLWTEITGRQYTVNLMSGVKQPLWYMVPIAEKSVLSVLAVNLEVTDWIFVCEANYEKGSQKICTSAVHLSHKSLIAPSARYKRRTAHLDLQEVKKSYPEKTHIIVRVLPTDEPVVLHFDSFQKTAREINVQLPAFWSVKKHEIVARTRKNALFYELKLPDLQHVAQSYILQVEPLRCSFDQHHATALLNVPWSNENFNGYITDDKNLPLHIRLHSSKPISARNQEASVRLTLDPSCEYQISLKPYFIGTLSQLARHFSPLLLPNVAVVTLLTFRKQLMSFDEKGFPLFFVAMTEGLKPYYILTSVKLITKFLSFPEFLKHLPPPDMTVLIDENTDFMVLPLLLYTCSVGLVWILAVVFAVSVVMLESSINKVTLKFLAKTVRFPVTWTEYLLSAFHKLPFAVACILIFVSIRACGGLALCLGAVFYFLKLTQMSQDYIEDVLWFFLKSFSRRLKEAIQSRFKKSKKKDDNEKKEIESLVNGDDAVAGPSNEEKTEECEAKEAVKTEENQELTEARIESVNQTEVVHEESSSRPFTAHNSIFFHSSIFFIWTLITLINVPVVLTWAHNFKYSIFLTPDPSFIPGLALSLCAFPLWQMDFPYRKRWSKELCDFIMAVVVVSLIYAQISLYRLNYLLTIVIVIVTLHQLFAPSEETNEIVEDSDKKVEDKYDKVKAKLD